MPHKEAFEIFRNSNETDLQQVWSDVYNQMIIHTRGLNPDKLLSIQRPYEAQEIKDYRLLVFEPITQDIFNDAFNDLHRIMKGSNLVIEADEEIKEHIQQDLFRSFTLRQYINEVVIRAMIEDPNGMLIFWPTKIPETENDRLGIKPVIVNSFEIVENSPEALVWLIGVKEDDTEVFHSVDTVMYSRIEIKGKQRTVTPIYQHDIGTVPSIILGGIMSATVDNQPYFQSYFSGAVPHANKALRHDSDHEGTMTTAGSPIRELEERPCLDCKGVGKLFFKDNTEWNKCGTCNGQGIHIPSGPYSFIIRKSGNKNIGEETSRIPAMQYITPPIPILAFQQTGVAKDLNNTREALNQLFTLEAQSGIAKEVDREDKRAMVDRIGMNIARILKQAVVLINKLVFPEIEPDVNILTPVTFRERTEADISRELAALKESKAPQIVINQVTREFIQRRFAGMANVEKMLDVLEVYDPLFSLDRKEKIDLLASGGIQENDLIRSERALQAIRSVMLEEFDFEGSTVKDIITRIEAIISPFFPLAIPAVIAPNGQTV